MIYVPPDFLPNPRSLQVQNTDQSHLVSHPQQRISSKSSLSNSVPYFAHNILYLDPPRNVLENKFPSQMSPLIMGASLQSGMPSNKDDGYPRRGCDGSVSLGLKSSRLPLVGKVGLHRGRHIRGCFERPGQSFRRFVQSKEGFAGLSTVTIFQLSFLV